MGLRGIKRQIAKARMKVTGAERINRKFSVMNADGIPNWKVALYGKTGAEAHRVQMNHGRLLKAQEDAKAVIKKRKVKKVTA